MSDASLSFRKMGNRLPILQNGRPFCRKVDSPFWVDHSAEWVGDSPFSRIRFAARPVGNEMN
eukprot:6189515-Pleurochrysis_carterae.AAC.1